MNEHGGCRVEAWLVGQPISTNFVQEMILLRLVATFAALVVAWIPGAIQAKTYPPNPLNIAVVLSPGSTSRIVAHAEFGQSIRSETEK